MAKNLEIGLWKKWTDLELSLDTGFDAGFRVGRDQMGVGVGFEVKGARMDQILKWGVDFETP